MQLKPRRPRRRATRLRDYDYGQTGGYFVTICAQDQECLFGRIIGGRLQLSEIGKIVAKCWNRIPKHFLSVELDVCVVMPNHIHGIIVLGTRAARFPRPSTRSQPDRRGEVASPGPQNSTGSVPSPSSPKRTDEAPSPTLGQVVAYFKYQSTKSINQHRDTPGTRIWQRNYYDHVIRDDRDLQRIRQYITDNPMQWELDQLHPSNFYRASNS